MSTTSSLEHDLDELAQSATSDSGDRSAHSATVIDQVHAWLKREKTRHQTRKAKRQEARAAQHARRGSDVSDDGPDLERLEQILKESFPFTRHYRRDSSSVKRPSIRRLLHRASPSIHPSSDTDYFDGEPAVPKVEAWLDNTQVHRRFDAVSTNDLTVLESRSSEQAWAAFKYEIVRLTHTLRLKGWRRVPMERSGEIEVKRLSGALTNAVYVVTPPEVAAHEMGEDGKLVPRRCPRKLLLRIYGPQVEHLIDRDAELEILKRLARKKIGPRLLGTFTNGRFEEYLHALPLTPKELRTPLVSEQIAKRMRELHEGIDLLDEERDKGPFVWHNWDKWLKRVGEVVTWLDSQNQSSGGYVCGTTWAVFLETVKKYRVWLLEQSGGQAQLREEMIFSHNDTQYGNILRITPSGTSPLLLPANSHKQLVVIDFEYASQNTPGLEFANHFTEWCYDYHDEKYSWRCNAAMYPDTADQTRFMRAYVRHRPELEMPTPRMTPMETVAESPGSPQQGLDKQTAGFSSPGVSMSGDGRKQSLSTFLLDARAPTSGLSSVQTPLTLSTPKASEDLSQDFDAEEQAQVAKLIRDTRLWRTANSAQWVAWGIVQARVPGMPEAREPEAQNEVADTAQDAAQIEARQQAGEKPGTTDEDDEGAFDYLAYARDRAMFFWGDIVKMGFMALEDLPADVQRDIKVLDY